MKNVILISLRLLNFKGIRDLSILFNGDTNVFGSNEAGKSTIYTAFTWLLTGKDEFDRKDYEIKNTKHKELNSQAHEVEAILSVNGKDERLKRVYLEKWTKPKGQSTKVFEGHKTEFYYNDVPCSASEYQSKVDAIIDAAKIKLVTNPTYFNTLPWQDQRRGLIGIAGVITDAMIFDEITTVDNKYFNLINILNSGKNAEEYKKELAAKKLLLKKASVEFQPRIDELKRGLPEGKDWKSIDSQISAKQGEIALIDELLTSATKALNEKQRGLVFKQKNLHEKQTALSSIRFKIKSELQNKQNESAGEIDKVQRQIKSINDTILFLQKEDTTRETNIASYQSQLQAKNKVIETLRTDWSTINAEKFEFDESKCECPTCKQALPTEQIETQKAELLTNFNTSKQRRKDAKVAESNQVKAEIKQLEEKIESLNQQNNADAILAEQNKIPALNTKLSTLQLTAGKKQVDDLETAVDALMALNGDAMNIKEEIEQIEIDIKLETEALGVDEDAETHKLRKATIQADIDQLRKQLGDKEVIDRTNKRISELEKEEQANAQAIADLEQQEFEVETYTRAKMDILEKRVNSMFHYVKFRMFETQVNGGIAETCVCEYNGVPYPTLNTAAKLLAGLDVLNTLSDFYGIHAPVFCDNRESVTFIPDCKSQIISLYVSPEDKKLRIEPASKKAFAFKENQLFAEAV